MAKRPSINHVPEDLRDSPLFSTAAELIDIARSPDSAPVIAQEIHPTVRALLRDSQFEDMEAVQAYHHMFVRPQMGTRAALLYVLNLLKIDAKLIEWFDADFNLPSYKFVLDFDEYPEDLEIDRLLDLINAVRNERSHLAVVRQPEGFQDLFVLDYSFLDDALLSDVGGYNYQGVNIFLTQKRTKGFDASDTYTFRSLFQHVHGHRIDESQYGDWILSDGPILGNTAQISPLLSGRAGILSGGYTVPALLVGKRVTWWGATHFILGDSALSDSHILALSWRDYVDNQRGGSFPLVEGKLDEDVILSDQVFDDIFVNKFVERYSAQIDMTSYTAPLVRDWHTVRVSKGFDDENYITTLRVLHTTHNLQTQTIERYGIGQPDGAPDEYKVSVRSAHRSETV